MEILFKSLASGLITGVILTVASLSGPKLAGAIGGVPIVFAISYGIILVGGSTATKDFLVGGIYGAIAAIFFSLILIWLNYMFHGHAWVNFGTAYILCFLLAYLMVYFTS